MSIKVKKENKHLVNALSFREVVLILALDTRKIYKLCPPAAHIPTSWSEESTSLNIRFTYKLHFHIMCYDVVKMLRCYRVLVFVFSSSMLHTRCLKQ